jgi:hypothetical protein
MQAILERAAGDSVVVRSARRMCADSLLYKSAAAILRPSMAHLGAPVAPETEAQSRQAIEGLWRTLVESRPGRAATRGIAPLSSAWRHSRVAAEYDAVLRMDPARRVTMLGWILLVMTLSSGVVKALSAEPWPALSMLIWAVAAGAAALLMARPREVAAAWQAYRGRR